jgi:hypothetical protein
MWSRNLKQDVCNFNFHVENRIGNYEYLYAEIDMFKSFTYYLWLIQTEWYTACS